MVKSTKKLPNKFISKLFLSSLRWYLDSIFCLNVEKNDAARISPPYLLIANHANFWDGVLVNLFIRDPICFLVSDEYFRKPILGKLLKIEGSIPKKKFLADFAAIKELLKSKAYKRIIGIFPEGKRNWDGSTEKIIFPTAKLIKILNVPVVRCLLRGSYLSFPRWARFTRKGKISLSYDLILTTENIKEMTVEEIYREISESLAYHEYDYQKKVMNTYRGRKLAEKIELLLFLCPNCHKIGFLYSRGDVLSCQSCGYQVKYDKYGFFSSEKSLIYFDNPVDWNNWQIEWIRKFIVSTLQKSSIQQEVKEIIKDKGVFLYKSNEQKKLNKKIEGVLTLRGEKLIFETVSGDNFCFQIKLIKGVNVQYNNKFEFYYKDDLYRFCFDNPSISAYKWYKMVELTQEILNRKL